MNLDAAVGAVLEDFNARTLRREMADECTCVGDFGGCFGQWLALFQGQQACKIFASGFETVGQAHKCLLSFSE